MLHVLYRLSNHTSTAKPIPSTIWSACQTVPEQQSQCKHENKGYSRLQQVTKGDSSLQQLAVSLQVGEDEAAGVPATGVAREGGDTPTARKCTYMELALCLAPGLDVNGVTILYKAAKPTLQVSTALLLLLLLLWTNSIGPWAAVGGSARIACVVTSSSVNMGCCIAGTTQLMQGYSLERVSWHSIPVQWLLLRKLVAVCTAAGCNLYSRL